MSRHRRRTAASLVEVVVAVAILVVLVGLLLPAIQKARESAARAQCRNNLRQVGLALHLHQATHRMLPGNGGWDGAQTIPAVDGGEVSVRVFEKFLSLTFVYGVGDPAKGPRTQPGSWQYAVLPDVEQGGVYQGREWAGPLALYTCPARRKPVARLAVEDEYGVYVTGGWAWARTDYAGNAKLFPNRPEWAALDDIKDGHSQTLLAAEKAMHPKNYATGTWYWDEPYFVGGSGGTVRGFGPKPGDGVRVLRDDAGMGFAFRYNWGAAHPDAMNALFADGSVRSLKYSTPEAAVAALLTPSGGDAVPDDQ